jgi:hypothetical protein
VNFPVIPEAACAAVQDDKRKTTKVMRQEEKQ